MTLEDFFRENARLYSEGDVARSACAVDVPLTARIAESTFAANTLDDVVAALQIYRANMLVESYVRTEIVEFHETEPVNGRAQAFIRYRNVNDQGAEISSFDMTFICRQTDDGGWAIIEVECLPPVTSRFLEGVPLA